MTVAKPDAGELVRTVVELVDAVNAGGGSVDLTDYQGETISLTATAVDGDIALNANGAVNIAVDGSDSHVRLLAQQDPIVGDNFAEISVAEEDGISLEAGTSIRITASGTDGNVDISADSDVNITSTNISGGVNISSEGNFGVDVNGDGKNINISTNTGAGAITVSANGSGGTVNISCDDALELSSVTQANLSSDGSVILLAPVVGVNGDEIGFFSTPPVARPTGVPVTAAGVHAALVALGLITA